MFGLDITVLMFTGLAAASAAALVYALMFTTIQNEKKADRRLETIKRAETDSTFIKATRDRTAEAARRRKSVQDSLKELENKQKARNTNTIKPPLRVQIRQAGLNLPMQRFQIYSLICGLVTAFLLFIFGLPWLVVGGGLVIGFFGLPRWFIAFLRQRRIKAFLEEFPNALDIIVRAIRSGLPLNDAIRLIAAEAPEPVKAEFRRIVESQQMGLSLPDAVMRMPETMPCSEASFFGIVIQIQNQAGGNLGEALGNLSKVLRDRKKMKAKIQALSMEAKVSAMIIGALPFIVAFLVYLSSPGYIMPLFTTSIGHLILVVSGIWMSMGLFVMKKMMNFDI